MTTTRRNLLTNALTGAGAAVTCQGASAEVRNRPHEHEHVPPDPALRVKALESLMVAKGLVDRAALDALIETYEHKVGPHIGARVIARAWKDAAFKQRLLADGNAAVAELGYGQPHRDLVVVENTATIHNLVTCTLCSCYPWTMLGLPPVWYKSDAYRSRSVIDPRGILKEFGLDLGDDVELRVWDSTADRRYVVLPERPAGTDGMDERQMAALVTRDAMIGTAKVTAEPKGSGA
jgi:nitrile hydratase subunit alpha